MTWPNWARLMEGSPVTIKNLVKALLPRGTREAIQKYRLKKTLEGYKGLTTQQIFTKIYEKGAWGKSKNASEQFFSGSGSHDEHIVTTYRQAIQSFLESFPKKPNVVDLGCGDFNIGASVRRFCDKYTACDIVPSLIAFNREKYKGLDVDFRVLDLSEDELPQGDVVFIRQVLQHLSNQHISRALPKIAANYKFLVLTEHLPSDKNFTPNLDKPAGLDVRLNINSGIIPTAPPFNLKTVEERVLCEIVEYDGTIRTTLYTLP